MTILREIKEVTVTEAAKQGVAGLVSEAEHGADVVVTRRSRPVAAVVGMQRLVEIEQAVADLSDLSLVLVRAVTDSGARTSLEDVLRAYGHTRASLAELPAED